VHSRSTVPAVLGALALALVSCAPAPASTPSPAGTGAGHGAISGAAELDEPALGLTTIDPSGVVRHLDLLDETTAELGEIDAPRAMHTDGRYLFADTADGVAVIDSGVWTWDHVDHFHYYRAEARLLGVVEGDGPARIATTTSSTTGSTGVFFTGSGEAVLLDTEALSKGELVERWRIDASPGEGMVVPVGSYALVAQNDTAIGYDADGEQVDAASHACVEVRGTITTRVGAVVGCADGALLASVGGGGLAVERIAYPEGTTAPAATTFANREGRPTVAALAGDAGIWLLDTRERSWTLLPAPAPLVSATAVDDEAGHVLALAADGRVLVLDETGTVLSQTGPLVADVASATLIADQQRAYLGAAAERRLYEIDFGDGARLSRTFETESEPAFLAETGR
jgi:hypothetical protein